MGRRFRKTASFNVKSSLMLPQMCNGHTVLLPANRFTTEIHLSLVVLTDKMVYF